MGITAGSLGLALLAFGTGPTPLGGASSAATPAVAGTGGPDLTALPLGDGKVTSSGPRRGYVYSCQESFGGPAAAEVPWIHNSSYDLTAKYTVDGAVNWPGARFNKKLARKLLKLSGNGLPTNHPTGAFPVAASDDAYAVDANPNSISAQSVALKLSGRPRRLKRAQCTPTGQVGIMRNGVAIFNALDAGGKDAVAHEVQDSCSGHPQQSGVYHYHGLPACIGSGGAGKHSKRIGWALDGYPIHGPLGSEGEYMRTSDLDACHGHAHKIRYQGRVRKLFHYHATEIYPYVISCFRAEPVTLDSSGRGAQQPPPARALPG